MDKRFDFVVGSSAIDQQLEFRAFSVVVDNPTNQWVSLDALGVVIPQYTIGATYPMPGTTRARLSFTAPAGQVEPPTIAGQVVSVTFYDLALPLTAGVGMLGGRAPYYDRNPTSKNFRYFNANVAPHALTTRWTYTVPAGRRAYLEMGQAFVQTEAAGDLAPTNLVGFSESGFNITPAGGSSTFLVVANVQGLVPNRTIHSLIFGSSMELQPAEVIVGTTANTYTATNCTHLVSAKITEFDA